MIQPHYLVSVWRILLLLMCAGVVFIVVDKFDKGLNVGTSLSDMVPVAQDDIVRAQALQQAQDIAEQGVVLMLEASDTEQLNAAIAFVHSEIDSLPHLLYRSNAAGLTDSVVARFAAHRFHLLSSSDREQLLNQQYDEVLESTFADLYSPGGRIRLLSVLQDPFNFFGSFVESGLTSSGFTLSNAVSPPDDNQALDRELISLRLLTSVVELAQHSTLDTFFKSLDQAVLAQFPAVRLLHSGVLFFSNEAATSAKKDINLISGGSAFGLLLLLLVVFRSIWPLVTTLLSILVGVTFAFSVVVWIYGSIHVFTIVFGASLIGIVIDYSIHYFYHMAMSDINVPKSSTPGSSRSLNRALVLSLLTSMVGYSALMMSSVLMLQKIAVFSVCGITAAWLTVMALAPITAGKAVPVRRNLIDLLLRSMSTLVMNVAQMLSRTSMVIAMVAMSVTVFWYAEGQDDPRLFVDLSPRLLQESAEINAHISGVEPGRFLLVQGFDEQEMFDRLSLLYQQAGSDTRLISALDWLPSPSVQRLNYELLDAVYASGGIAEALFSTLGVEASQQSLLYAEYGASENSFLPAEQFFAALQSDVSSLVMATENNYAGYVLIGSGSDLAGLSSLASRMPGVEYVDSVTDSISQLRQQRVSALGMLALAYIIVGVMMLIVYRHSRALLMLAVPVCSTIVTLYVLTLMGEALTIFHTMALFLILGLGMDYVVFLNEMTVDRQATLQAIVLSALTSILSFGLLSLSSVPVAQAFGFTVLIGNTMNLLATIALAGRAWNSQHRPLTSSNDTG